MDGETLELLAVLTRATDRLIHSVSAMRSILRETVPDFDKKYRDRFVEPEQDIASELEEIREKANNLARRYHL